MIILGLDCTLDNCAVAISRNGELIEMQSHACKNNQAEILPTMVSKSLESAKISPKEITKLAVTTGPGSFTGVRIGLSFAKSLALSIGAPCIGISSLEAFAIGSAQLKSIAIICVAGSVFMAAYEGRTIIMPPTRFEDFAALNDFSDEWALCGQGAAFAKLEHPKFNVIGTEIIDPYVLCTLASERDEIAFAPNPLYLRGADVKLWAGYKAEHSQGA